MKCANVAISVVPGVGDVDAESWNRHVVFYFDIVARFCTILGSIAVFFQFDVTYTFYDPLKMHALDKYHVCPSVLP